MDNICHGLAGAVIAHSGFARRLPRATLLGIVAANIPDVDVFVYLFGADAATAVSFRRGWTHGFPALAVWTLLLAAAFARWERRWPSSQSPLVQAAPTTRTYASLAAIAVLSHPALDWMNTYGVRFLKPFSDRWFYGDTLFIVDPVLLALFGMGWLIARQLLRHGSASAELVARGAIGIAFAYVVVMKSLSASTRTAAAHEYGLDSPTDRELMVVPRPLAWFVRDVVVKTATTYDRYQWAWQVSGPIQVDNLWSSPTGADPAVVAAVRFTREGAKFLVWSRLPYFVPDSATRSIFVGDMRYTSGTEESWAGMRVRTGSTTQRR